MAKENSRTWGDAKAESENPRSEAVVPEVQPPVEPPVDLEVEGEWQPPEVLQSILDEVNARFDAQEDKELVGGWLNRAMEFAGDGLMASLGPVMQPPLDVDGLGVLPGERMAYADGRELVVIAVDSENVYYDMGGGNMPTSVAPASQLRHAAPACTVGEALEWFEENIDMVDTAERRAEVYSRCEDMVREAIAAGA